jgi:hypothetical protein
MYLDVIGRNLLKKLYHERNIILAQSNVLWLNWCFFCFVDNLIYVEEGKSVVISWTTKVDQPNYNVAFNQLSNHTDDLIV